MPERRRYKRRFVNLPASIGVVGQEGHSGQMKQFLNCRILNVSEGGVCVELQQTDRESPQSLLFNMNGKQIEVSVPKIFGGHITQGNVVWASQGTSTRVGVKLNYPDPIVRNLIHSYVARPHAAKYTLGLYKVAWERTTLSSLFGLVRDLLVFCFPFRIPRGLVSLLYGVDPKFAFYVHPRRREDILISLPFLKYLFGILPSKWLLAAVSAWPPFVVGHIVHPQCSGLIVGSQQMPDSLMRNVKCSIRKARSTVRFVGKLCPPGSVLGLGAWWPIVTRRGEVLKADGKRHNVQITNGHCGTLISIHLMIQKISRISGVKLTDLRVGIIGVGKMGQNVAAVLNGKVGTILLSEVNQKRLDSVVSKLRQAATQSVIETIRVTPREPKSLRALLEQSHLSVCTTSNVGKVLTDDSLPEKFVVIDDSRPEAFYRGDPSSGRIVLEGGLMKLRGVRINYDFGFGIGEDIFGCLAESYLLASDAEGVLKPSIGNVDLDNFWKMIQFCEQKQIEVGDFRAGAFLVGDAVIADVVRNRHLEITGARPPFGIPAWRSIL